MLLPDSQPYKNLFILVQNFLNDLGRNNWIVKYINLELYLLKELGFDPFLQQFYKDIDKFSDHKVIEIDNIKYQVPIFLLKEKNNEVIDNKNISIALSFTRNLLSNKFFLPNNLNFPKARILLENYFN